jgi:hypothetical protein
LLARCLALTVCGPAGQYIGSKRCPHEDAPAPGGNAVADFFTAKTGVFIRVHQ